MRFRISNNKSFVQDDIIYRKRYTTIPAELFKVLRGYPTALVIWTYLFSQSEDWHPSLCQVADDTGFAVNTVRKAIRMLTSRNMLQPKIGGWRRKTTYTFTPVEEWTAIIVPVTPE